MSRHALVLAAGKGTRMRSGQIKIIHSMNGLPVIVHLLRSLQDAGVDRCALVVGYQADLVEACVSSSFGEVTYVEQKEQLGTGHAVLMAMPWLQKIQGTVLILPGDCPLVRPATLRALAEKREAEGLDVVVLAADKAEPGQYGRVIVDSAGRPQKIVEAKDASPEELRCTLINAGVYAFDARFLQANLHRLSTANVQGEYYLTDVIAMSEKGATLILKDESETLGINSRRDLAELGARQRQRINDGFMEAGITLIDPDRTYIEVEVSIGQDTIIYPGAYLYRGVSIGARCVIGPNALVATDLPEGSHVGQASACRQ